MVKTDPVTNKTKNKKREKVYTLTRVMIDSRAVRDQFKAVTVHETPCALVSSRTTRAATAAL